MKKTILILTGLVATTQACATETSLPPVLNYYPECEYSIIDESTASHKHKIPLSKESKSELIQIIRQTAKTKNADAVILTDRAVKRIKKFKGFTDSHRDTNFNLTFDYQLIKNCQDTKPQSRFTNYNDRGNVSLSMPQAKREMSFSIKIPEKPKLRRPELENRKISIDEGIYGLKLGDSIEQVVATLGDPSVELNHFADQQVLGFGRRHWFYFADDKLVRVQTNQALLTLTTLNKIPIWDAFDNHDWLIGGDLQRGTGRDIVLKRFKQDDSEAPFTLASDEAELRLFFTKITDTSDNSANEQLANFDYRVKGYKAPTPILQPTSEDTYELISAMYDGLKANQEPDSNPIDLSQVKGKIWLTPREQFNIVNDNLIVKTKAQRITKVQFVESVFSSQESDSSPWYIGQFIAGQSMADVRPHLDEYALEMYQDVVIDMDLFSLTLAFEEVQGKNRLYQADLTIY